MGRLATATVTPEAHYPRPQQDTVFTGATASTITSCHSPGSRHCQAHFLCCTVASCHLWGKVYKHPPDRQPAEVLEA